MAADKSDSGMSPDAETLADSESISTPVTWRVTRNVEEEDLRCDLCGAQADTVHIIPSIGRAEKAVFACDDHCPEPQGYMIPLHELFTQQEKWETHLFHKRSGDEAWGMIADRVYKIKFDLVEQSAVSRISPIAADDQARYEQSVHSAFLDIMDAAGAYPFTRLAILNAIESGTKEAMAEHLAKNGNG